MDKVKTTEKEVTAKDLERELKEKRKIELLRQAWRKQDKRDEQLEDLKKEVDRLGMMVNKIWGTKEW